MPLSEVDSQFGEVVNCAEWARLVDTAIQRCQRHGLTRDEAEDCVHDAVLAMINYQQAHGEVTRPSAWLGVVARRRWIDRLREVRRERRALARAQARVTAGAGPEEEVVGRAVAKWLADAVDTLPPMTRQVCHAIASGRTSDQVAVDLGLSRRAVDSHLTRARRLLRTLAASAVAALVAAVYRLVPHGATALAVAATAATLTLVEPPPHTVPLSTHSGLLPETAHAGTVPDPVQPNPPKNSARPSVDERPISGSPPPRAPIHDESSAPAVPVGRNGVISWVEKAASPQLLPDLPCVVHSACSALPRPTQPAVTSIVTSVDVVLRSR